MCTEYNIDIVFPQGAASVVLLYIRSNVEASTRTIDLAVGTVGGMHMHYVRTRVAVYAVHLTDVDVTTPTYDVECEKPCVKCQLVSSVNSVHTYVPTLSSTYFLYLYFRFVKQIYLDIF
jgi:hypothetical protein